MPRTLEESRRLFDQWAHTYADDLRTPQGILVGHADSLRIATELLSVPPLARVLDVGIGTGDFAGVIESLAGEITVSGVDPSEAMLARCADLHPGYDLRVGSFVSTPFESDHFDAVISSFAFHEVQPEDRPTACMELRRVLKSGGTLCLLDIMFASSSAVNEARRVLERFWDDEEDYALVADLDTLLRRAGFGAIRWTQTAPCHWAVLAGDSF
jgi:SAM-dependent methyltransferase